MNNQMTIKKLHPFIFFLILTLGLFGCSPAPERPEEENNTNNPPELPQVLEEMEEDLLNVMHDLDMVEGIQASILEEKQQEAQEATEESYVLRSEEDEVVLAEEEDESDDDEESGIDVHRLVDHHQLISPLLTAEDIEGNLELGEMPPEEIEEVWFEINNQIDELHRKWNVLEPELQKAKVDRSTIEEFESRLDQLSLTVLDQEVLESLIHANQLTLYLAQYRGNFDADVPNEIYKMRFHIRESILLAARDRYAEALEATESVQELEEHIRHDLLENDAEDVVQKFQLSIDDLMEELNNENLYLAQIKAPIVIKNIMLMEETFREDTEETH